MDINNPHYQENLVLNSILNELSIGNISVLDIETKKILAAISEYLSELQQDQFDEYQVMSLKSLIMICNILYNRTDMLVLPVEDGVYDLLMEMYKKFDPNFQVGSYVVQFQANVDKALELEGLAKPKQVISFYPKEKKDETREYFEEQLKRFDKNRLNCRDVFYNNPIFFEESESQYISKRTRNTKHNHPMLVGTLDKCKFVLDADAIEKDAQLKSEQTRSLFVEALPWPVNQSELY